MTDDWMKPPSKVPKSIISPEPEPPLASSEKSSNPPTTPPSAPVTPAVPPTTPAPAPITPPTPLKTPPNPPQGTPLTELTKPLTTTAKSTPPPTSPPSLSQPSASSQPTPAKPPAIPPIPPPPGQPIPSPASVNTPPNLPPPPPPTPSKSSRKGLVIALLIFAILLVIGVGAYAFLGDWNPFQKPLTSTEVLNNMFMRLPDIATAEQQTTFSFVSQVRDANAISPAEALPELYKHTQQIERDQERLRNMTIIQSTLARIQQDSGSYPVNLEEVRNQLVLLDFNPTLDSFTEQPYGYRQEGGGSNYILHIQFETDAALSAITAAYTDQQVTPVIRNGNTLELSADSPLVFPTVSPDGSALLTLLLSDKLYQALPAEINLELKSNGSSQINQTIDSDSQTTLSGNLALGDASFQVGADFRKKGRNFFARLNQAPSLGFFDPAALKGQWVHLSLDDIPNQDFQDALSDITTKIDEQNSRVREQYQVVINQLQSSGVLEVTEELPQQEDEFGQYYHYRLRLLPEKIAPFYQQTAQALQQQFGDQAIIPYSEEVFTELSNPDFITYSQLTSDNTTFELLIDDQEFWPRSFSLSSRLVPPTSVPKLANTQYRTTYAVELSQINQPLTVEEPAPTITWQQAVELVTGIPQENTVDALDLKTLEGLLPALNEAQSLTEQAPTL